MPFYGWVVGRLICECVREVVGRLTCQHALLFSHLCVKHLTCSTGQSCWYALDKLLKCAEQNESIKLHFSMMSHSIKIRTVSRDGSVVCRTEDVGNMKGVDVTRFLLAAG